MAYACSEYLPERAARVCRSADSATHCAEERLMIRLLAPTRPRRAIAALVLRRHPTMSCRDTNGAPHVNLESQMRTNNTAPVRRDIIDNEQLAQSSHRL